MADWRNYGARLTHALGFPSAALRGDPPRGLKRDRSRGAETQSGRVGGRAAGGHVRLQDRHRAIAVDGKTLRGSQKQGAPGARLLSSGAPAWPDARPTGSSRRNQRDVGGDGL